MELVAIGIIVGPLYGLLIWLIRSYSDVNREIGELKKDIEQNARTIGELKDSVERLEKSSIWKPG